MANPCFPVTIEGWRAPKGRFKQIQNLIKSNNLIRLTLADYKQGLATFGVATNYDYYLLQKAPSKGKTTLTDVEGNTITIDLTEMPFIPNTSFKDYFDLVAKGDEEKVELIANSAYHSQRDYVSKVKSHKFKYPIVWSITQKNGINKIYSKINNKGHFGVPKVIISQGGGTYPIIDEKGEYGLSEFGYGIVDTPANLKLIKEALESEKFIKLMGEAGFRNLKYESKVIECFRKDFWREFV